MALTAVEGAQKGQDVASEEVEDGQDGHNVGLVGYHTNYNNVE